VEQPSDDFSALAERVPALLFMIDAEGRILQANQRFQNHAGVDGNVRWGRTWLSLVHAHDRSRALADWSAAMTEGRGIELRVRLCRGDGSIQCNAPQRTVHDLKRHKIGNLY
jgi:PAS domain S-box-containing protein